MAAETEALVYDGDITGAELAAMGSEQRITLYGKVKVIKGSILLKFGLVSGGCFCIVYHCTRLLG